MGQDIKEMEKISKELCFKNPACSKIQLILMATLFFSFLFNLNFVFADDISISAGYGFALFNPESKPYRLRYTKGLYDFYHVSLARENPIYGQFYLVAEPFLTYQARPSEGIDLGFVLSGKHYITKNFYMNIGVGIAYTTYGFKEQGTHLPFIIQAGVGYRWKGIFIEDRFKHYSNGGLLRPNMSINANIILIGIYI
ncbi:MAG TPA: acyloxyacyl hydrolase [Syntrophorhabdaceae bacterium]|nr:acyloxyacyl hydrolase [Syntrophorhabdaceae bacterium]HPU29185.1 acyloxyacyl hydrolase [Syntrophorhabdaceae bacterium]